MIIYQTVWNWGPDIWWKWCLSGSTIVGLNAFISAMGANSSNISTCSLSGEYLGEMGMNPRIRQEKDSNLKWIAIGAQS